MFGSGVGSALLPVPSAVFAVWAMNKQTKKTIKPEPTPLTQLSGKGLVMQAKIQGLAQET